MKKVLSVFLCMLLMLSLCTPAFAAEGTGDIKVTVANDLHYSLAYSSAATVKKHNSISKDYSHISSTGKLNYESVAIFDAFMAAAAASDSDAILVPGDIVEAGTVAEHIAVSERFLEFEQTTGKQIYVVPGNHDLFKTSTQEFYAAYYNYGYDKALATDTNSLSYTVDLNDEYRLLAIDSTNPGKGPHGMTQARVDWIAQQCAKAKEDGKKLIAMMHHTLLDHVSFTSKIHMGESVNADIELAEVLADGGVKYIFTGHIHIQDILSYTSKGGATIYDVVTGSLTTYPCPYREVSFSEEVKFETKKIESIDYSNVASGISEKALALAKSDFQSYAYECARVGMRIVMASYIKGSALVSLLKINKEENPELYALIERVGDRISEVAEMPLYARDAAEGENSVEAIITSFGKTIPYSEYKDLLDLLGIIYLAYQSGDEDYPSYTKEILIATRAIAAVFTYALEDVSAQDYAVVLKLLFDSLGVEVDAGLLEFTGSIVSIYEYLELVLTTAVIPMLTNISDDAAPADNNVILPGYGTPAEESLSIWEQILEFFRKIFNFIAGIFNIA